MARSSDVARRTAVQSSAIRSDIAKRCVRAGGACGDYRGRGAIDLKHIRSYDTAGASRGRPRVSARGRTDGRHSVPSDEETHLIVLPGGGYAEHTAHEAEPVADWLSGLGFGA